MSERNKTWLRVSLAVLAVLVIACGPGGGKEVGGKDDKMKIGRACGNRGPGKVEGPEPVWFIAVVCTLKLNPDGVAKAATKRVRVVITAFDQKGVPGLWIDTPQNGPPVPRPYPKDTNEITPYRHPIFVAPGLVVTASVSATMLGREGEFVECWFEDMRGAEMLGTYSMAAIDKVGPNGNGSTTVLCNTVFGG